MHEVRMPQLGQTVEEASIVQWFKQEGDKVAEGEPLYSIQTDKAEIECEAPAGGVLRKILLAPDVVAPVLSVVALIGAPDEPLPDLSAYGQPQPAGAQPAREQYHSARDAAPQISAALTHAISLLPHGLEAPPSCAPMREDVLQTLDSKLRPVSPRARRRAQELGVPATFASGSGVNGRIMEADVLAYAAKAQSIRATPTARRLASIRGVDLTRIPGSGPRNKVTKADVVAAVAAPSAAPMPTPVPSVRRVPVTPMRRIIAERMVQSMFSAPHYYITMEVDMSAAREFRQAASGSRPSYNELVMYAAVQALRAFPSVNARWLGDFIEEVSDINIAFAVALPHGLVVPVVKKAQDMSLEEMCRAYRNLLEKARTNKLLPEDYSDNTFTVTNLGASGVEQFMAIINPPDSAILAVGIMKDRPVVVDGQIQIRPIMKLTLSSDHRVIDGAVAAQFLQRIQKTLERSEF